MTACEMGTLVHTNPTLSHPLGGTELLQVSLCEPAISGYLIFQHKLSMSSSSEVSEPPYSTSADAKLERIIINLDKEFINWDENTFINNVTLLTCGWV